MPETEEDVEASVIMPHLTRMHGPGRIIDSVDEVSQSSISPKKDAAEEHGARDCLRYGRSDVELRKLALDESPPLGLRAMTLVGAK
jgi:hypothetical protein